MGGKKPTNKKTDSHTSRNYLVIASSFVSFIGISAFLMDKYYFDEQFSSWASLLLALSCITSFNACLVPIISKNVSKPIDSSPQEVRYSSEILESINEGVLLLDRQGEIKLANPSAKNLVGWGDGETEKINYESFVKFIYRDGSPIDPRDNVVKTSLESQQARSSRNLSVKTVSGKNIPIQITAEPLSSGDGTIVTLRDITKEVEDDRDQKEFISTASHEMRTPVAAIEGYLGLALNPKISQIDEKAKEYITKAQESAKHLGILFKNLLTISKTDDDRIKLHMEAVDLVDYVEQITESFRILSDEKKLELIYLPNFRAPGVINIAPNLFARIDKASFREALSNLIENAIKYTAQGSIKVDVKLSPENDILVKVIDSGVGIPAEDIPHLFEKFYRVDNRETREIGGTGLGLYLTRRLIEKMGGSLFVESELRAGSTFGFRLSRLDEKEAKQLIYNEQSTRERTVYAEEDGQITIANVNQPTSMSNYRPTIDDNKQLKAEEEKLVEGISQDSKERLKKLGYFKNTEAQDEKL